MEMTAEMLYIGETIHRVDELKETVDLFKARVEQTVAAAVNSKVLCCETKRK